MVKCSNCGLEIDDNFQNCPNCGNDLSKSDVEVKKEEISTCNSCGAPLKDSDSFCASCGSKVEIENSALRCKNCGSELPQNAVFCQVCGAKVELAQIVVGKLTATPHSARNAGQTYLQVRKTSIKLQPPIHLQAK